MQFLIDRMNTLASQQAISVAQEIEIASYIILHNKGPKWGRNT